MKTNQILKREQNGFLQRTKDGYFDATYLIETWNINNPNNQKQLAQYKKLQSTNEYLDYLKKEGIEVPMISGRGIGGGTWMHPKLIIDLAMWVSVELKAIVIGYVLDGLIVSRIDAGDYYNEMCATILEKYVSVYGSKPPVFIYINEANLVRSLVTEKKDRNEMTEKELQVITALQKINTSLIEKGVGKESRTKNLKLIADSLLK